MKKLIAMVGLVAVGLSAYGQGTVLFQNVGPGLNAPVTQTSGVLVPAGNSFTAELLVGGTADALTPVAGTTGFAQAGYFLGGTKTLDGFAPGAQPFFQVRVWENFGGTILTYDAAVAAGGAQYGNTTFQLGNGQAGSASLGGGSPPLPAPALVGMTGFSLVPEPSTYALLALGAAALFLRRRK
jgi:hypothetical protein